MSQLERLFTPRWAGGWAVSRVLFGLASALAQAERFNEVRDALASPSLVLSSGPTRVADHVILGAGPAWAVWAAGFLGSAGLLVGGRLAKPGLVTWFLSHATLLVALGLNVRAPERVIVFATIALLLAPIGERALWTKARSPAPRWFMMVFFSALYGSTGFMKALEEPAWWTGDALPYDLVDRHHAGGVLAAWISSQHWLCFLLGWGTILFEAGFPFLIGFARLTPFVLLAGIGMHGTIEALMEVGPLGYVAVSLYPALLDPDIARGLWDRLAPRVAFIPGLRPAAGPPGRSPDAPSPPT